MLFVVCAKDSLPSFPAPKKASASERIIEFSNGLVFSDAFSNIFFFLEYFYVIRVENLCGSRIICALWHRILDDVIASHGTPRRNVIFSCSWSLIKSCPSEIPVFVAFARFFTNFDSTSINSKHSTSNFCNIHPHPQIHGVSSAFRVLTIFVFRFNVNALRHMCRTFLKLPNNCASLGNF